MAMTTASHLPPRRLNVAELTHEVGFDPLCGVIRDPGEGMFCVRAGIEAHAAVFVSNCLLTAAEAIISANIDEGMDEMNTYLVAFALNAARSIEAAVRFEP